MLRRMKLEGTCEPRSGYWVAKVAKLGIFGYGDSPDDARARADLACDMLFEHWEKHGVLEERLHKAGVEFENVEHLHWSNERAMKVGPSPAAQTVIASGA